VIFVAWSVQEFCHSFRNSFQQ